MITQEEKVDQVRSVTLDCQWGTGERLLAMNSSGVRETSRVLKVGYNTVLRTLKNSHQGK